MAHVKRHILFVDDDPMALAMIRSMLSQSGYTVTIAENGHDALDLVHKYPFDLILLDIMMSKMNGLDLLKRLKAQPDSKDIPVIMVSAKDDPPTMAKAKQFGAEDYAIKPPHRDVLLKKIENTLGGRPRFAEVYIDAESEKRKCYIKLDSHILSIGESGLTFWSPIAKATDSYQQLESPIFKDLGVITQQFKVSYCQPFDSGGYIIYLTYFGLKENEIKAIREWVVSQAILGRTVA